MYTVWYTKSLLGWHIRMRHSKVLPHLRCAIIWYLNRRHLILKSQKSGQRVFGIQFFFYFLVRHQTSFKFHRKKRRNGVYVPYCCPSRRNNKKISTTGELNNNSFEINSCVIPFHQSIVQSGRQEKKFPKNFLCKKGNSHWRNKIIFFFAEFARLDFSMSGVWRKKIFFLFFSSLFKCSKLTSYATLTLILVYF